MLCTEPAHEWTDEQPLSQYFGHRTHDATAAGGRLGRTALRLCMPLGT